MTKDEVGDISESFEAEFRKTYEVLHPIYHFETLVDDKSASERALPRDTREASPGI